MNIGTIDLDQIPDSESQLRKDYKRANRCAWCCGVTGVVLFIMASLTPWGMQ